MYRRTFILVSNERAKRVLYISVKETHAGAQHLGEKASGKPEGFQGIFSYYHERKSMKVTFYMFF